MKIKTIECLPAWITGNTDINDQESIAELLKRTVDRIMASVCQALEGDFTRSRLGICPERPE